MIHLTGESNDSLHLTGFSLLLIMDWSHDAVDFRQVNSGVRILLNAQAQNIESAILNLIEAADFLKASESWML